MEILGVLVAGISLGFLGKWIAVGDKERTPLWLTLLCGIVGALIGWIIHLAWGGSASPGFDWGCWSFVVVCAAIPVVIASTLTGLDKIKLPR